MIEQVMSVVSDGGIVVICVFIVLGFALGFVYTKGQHNSIVSIKDQQIADRDKIIERERATNERLIATLESYEDPLKAVGHFFTSTLARPKVEGG